MTIQLNFTPETVQRAVNDVYEGAILDLLAEGRVANDIDLAFAFGGLCAPEITGMQPRPFDGALAKLVKDGRVVRWINEAADEMNYALPGTVPEGTVDLIGYTDEESVNPDDPRTYRHVPPTDLALIFKGAEGGGPDSF